MPFDKARGGATEKSATMKDFTPVPNKWIDSLADGRLTPPMYAILSYLMRACTWKNGVWRGEAERIAYHLNRAWSVRQINRYLTRLHKCGYVTRKNVPGRRGGYKILLNNYVSVDDSEEKLLRPTQLKDWRDLEDVDVPDDDSETSLTMALRRLGDVPDDDSEMSSNPDTPNVFPDVPNRTDDLNNNNRVVDVVPDSQAQQATSGEEPRKEPGTVAGFTAKSIREHVARFPKNTWVWANATEDALRRPGFVEHVMALEPPRRIATGHAAINPELHTGLDAGGRPWSEGKVCWCDKCGDMHPNTGLCGAKAASASGSLFDRGKTE